MDKSGNAGTFILIFDITNTERACNQTGKKLFLTLINDSKLVLRADDQTIKNRYSLSSKL